MKYQSKMTSTSKVATTLIGLLCFCQSIEASGIFELSLTSLVDSLGRDLRDDCCAWHNATNQYLSPSSSNQHLAHHHHHHQQQQHNINNHHQQDQQQTQSCDPSKCQLIIRICVKNYQTQQIEPSQCTFGELSAQVLRQASVDSDLLMFGGSGGNSLPVQYQPLLRRQQQQQQQQQQPQMRPAARSASTNIHHQRMLSQTQALPATSALFYNHQATTTAAARNFNVQQSRNLLSGQPRALRTVAFHQPISFPFNFTWPGSFSLIIDAWFESPLQQVAPNHFPSSPTTSYDLYKKQHIIKHSMRGWLAVKNEWTNDVHKTDIATLAYSYRVTCQTNYYGEQCNILCRPRDDIYGHYTCSQQGNIVCLPGWQGSYCLEPICSPGCHEGQGNCSRPNECSCRYGWQGPACEQCVLYPGCVHGSCNKPLECICEEGWGGLLCNEDLNFCANHQPCKNDGICTNTFDSNGVGSYTCACRAGFAGKNCERNKNDPESVQADSMISNVSMVAANLQQQQQVVVLGPAIEQPATAQQQVLATSKQVKQQPLQKPIYNHQKQQQQQQQQQPAQLSSFHYPMTQATSVGANHSGTNNTQLDSWVMIGWAVIMICSIILVLVYSFRTVIERASQRNGGQWYHSHHHQDGSHVEDVATLQNQQNLCKSRTSLNANIMAASMEHKSSPYDRVLSLVDGHEHLASIYESRYRQQQQQPGTSSNNNQRFLNNNNNQNSSPNSRRGDKGKKSHQQQYRSQHNLHATHENNNSSNHINSMDSSSSDAASSSSEAPAPPPPYTIAQSTHSYPNLAYQSLSSHYSRAPKAGPQPTAISNTLYGSNALYGSYSTYAGIPVVAAPAPSNRPPQQAGGADGSGSGGNSAAAAAAAAANSTYQSPHYLIYPVHFMPS